MFPSGIRPSYVRILFAWRWKAILTSSLARGGRQVGVGGRLSGRDRSDGVGGGPVQGVVGDLLPAVLPDREVGAAGELLVVGERLWTCAYFSALDLLTAAGMMWSSPPAMNSRGARSSLP